MLNGNHPDPDLLKRFLLGGSLSRAENRAIVRHLLTVCPSCRELTGRLLSVHLPSSAVEDLREETKEQSSIR